MNLGELSVTLGAVFDRFERNVDRARTKLRALGSDMRELVNRAAKVGAAATVAGVAIAATFVTTGAQAIDAQAKLSRAIGSTIDGLRGLQIAAEDAGIEKNTLNDAASKLTARLGEVRRQGGPAAEILKDLGLNAAELARLDVDQRFAAIADAMRAAGLSADQVTDALRQLGIEQKEVVGLFLEGGDAIRAAREEVDAFGLSVSAVDAAQVEAANDAMQRIGRSVEAVRNAFAIALAPILQEIAERFNELARANGGFREAATHSAEVSVRSLAKVGDVVQGLRVVFKGVELIARGFGAAVVSVAQIGTEAFVKFADFGVDSVNSIIAALNKLPGVAIDSVEALTDPQAMQSFRAFANDMRDEVGRTREELHALAMQEMPSAQAERFLEAVRTRAEEAAAAVVKAREAIAATGGGAGAEGFGSTDDEAQGEADAKEQERYRALLESKLEALREFTMSEEELEVAGHEARLAALQEALEAELTTETEYRALREALEEEHAERMRQIREKSLTDIERFTALSWGKQVEHVVGALVEMTAGVAAHSKKMFALNKAAAIANAIISTYAGVTKALEAYPPPLSFGMAAAQAAAGFAQVSAIKAQQFGGGGAAPSVTGTTAAPPVADVGTSAGGGAAARGQVITLQGLDPKSLFTGKQVRALLGGVQEALNDGGTLVFD